MMRSPRTAHTRGLHDTHSVRVTSHITSSLIPGFSPFPGSRAVPPPLSTPRARAPFNLTARDTGARFARDVTTSLKAHATCPFHRYPIVITSNRWRGGGSPESITSWQCVRAVPEKILLRALSVTPLIQLSS
ncbi:Hypothetical predicted protein [Pelobates cultripes]|uniref:Uncharacterized protein n=1 Tax=Pelobates cultripes TaxID=61616 RepID=A0AAD1RD66_PELCU|nr:Hypothetical predicted protein [Pelobates cultripes]